MASSHTRVVRVLARHDQAMAIEVERDARDLALALDRAE